MSLHVFSVTTLCLLIKVSFRKEGLTSIILTPWHDERHFLAMGKLPKTY